MPLSKKLIAYGASLVTFLFLDFLWLAFIARDFYQHYLKDFLTPDVNWVAAGVFYAFFVLGVVAFVVIPAHQKKSLCHATTYGAFFGAVTYATYDLTNYATLKNWPLEVVVLDITWGALLTLAVSAAGFYSLKKISR